MQVKVKGWISQGPNVAYKVDLTFESDGPTLGELFERFVKRDGVFVQGIGLVDDLPRGGYYGTTFTKREEIETILKGAARGSRFEIDYEFGLTSDRPCTKTLLIETIEMPSVFEGKDGLDVVAVLALAHPGSDRPRTARYLSPRIRGLTPVRKA